MNLDDFDIEAHDSGDDGHWEVQLTWAVYWPDEPLPPELMDGDAPARSVWEARSWAAGILARVLGACLDDIDDTRRTHGDAHYLCGRCRAYTSDEVTLPLTEDWSIGPPMIWVAVPAAQTDMWADRLTRKLEAVLADGDALPETGPAAGADVEIRVLRTASADRTKELP